MPRFKVKTKTPACFFFFFLSPNTLNVETWGEGTGAWILVTVQAVILVKPFLWKGTVL